MRGQQAGAEPDGLRASGRLPERVPCERRGASERTGRLCAALPVGGGELAEHVPGWATAEHPLAGGTPGSGTRRVAGRLLPLRSLGFLHPSLPAHTAALRLQGLGADHPGWAQPDALCMLLLPHAALGTLGLGGRRCGTDGLVRAAQRAAVLVSQRASGGRGAEAGGCEQAGVGTLPRDPKKQRCCGCGGERLGRGAG